MFRQIIHSSDIFLFASLFALELEKYTTTLLERINKVKLIFFSTRILLCYYNIIRYMMINANMF